MLLLACGLDSAQAGEREIAAQLRAAWEAARAAGTSGPLLDRLLGEALGMANRVRRPPGRHERRPHWPTSPPPACSSIWPARPGTVALIGVSPMTRRCGLALHRAGVPLLIVNRTLAPAADLAAGVCGRAVPLEQFRQQPEAVAALVLAAGGSEPLLDARALCRLAAAAARAPQQSSDLRRSWAACRRLRRPAERRSPRGAPGAGITRVGMSDLVEEVQQQRVTELLRLAPVRAAIDERLARLRDEMATRAIGPRLAELRGAFERIAADELQRALPRSCAV